MGKINIQGVKAGGKIIAKRLNLKPGWDTIEITDTPFENEAFSVFVGATDPDTFPDPDITYSVSGGSLPGGLSINSSTGEISGTVDPVESDTTSNFTLRAADGPLGPEQQGKAVDRDFNITVLNNEPPSFDQAINFSIGSVAELAAASLFQITASDPNTNPQAITFTEVGAVLGGESLSLDGSGNVTGTPPNAGGTRVVTFTVRADDGILTTDQAYKLTITDSQDPVWVTDAGALAAGSEGAAYSEFVVATDDNTIAYSITSGALPAGTSLNSSTGEISGTPTTAESASFEVTATDTIEFDATARSFSIEISLIIAESLRFNDDDLAQTGLSFNTDSNLKTWTFSTWLKRGNLSANMGIFGGGNQSNNNRTICAIGRNSSDQMRFFSNAGSPDVEVVSTAVLRDPSAWYHLVWAIDTTQATASDRVKLYVNGTQLTDLAFTDYPATQNLDLGMTDATYTTYIGRWGDNNTSPFDGYLADSIYVDGQQLTPTSFGEFDSNGDWQPIDVSGLTFGTNGFHLDYAVAPGTGDGGGTDVSGNDNHFADSGLAANDQVSDTPSNNYCTLNPLDWTQGTDGIFSDGNLVHRVTTAIGRGTYGTIAIPTEGKWYFEATYDVLNISQGQPVVTVKDADKDAGQQFGLGVESSGGFLYRAVSGNVASYITVTAGDTFGFAIDMDNGKAWLRKNGTWVNSGDPAAGTLPDEGSLKTTEPLLIFTQNRNNSQATYNFGQQAFADTAPSGFNSICTNNLPTPTIADPGDYFNTVLWMGDGFASKEITGVGFQPDLLWIKSRTSGATTKHHFLFDSVRGANQLLFVNTQQAEQTTAGRSFDADGFILQNPNNNVENESGSNNVAWNWKEGVTPGFDIVTYTGDGVAGRTVAHGLSAVPQMMVIKNRSKVAGAGWAIYHEKMDASAPEDFALQFTTAARAGPNGFWDNTAPTSTLFSVNAADNVNTLDDTFVAYLWAEVEGFSKFGGYTGNGSADGPFVWCGFKPAYVMLKINTGTTSGWFIYDGVRETFNPNEDRLLANTTGIEAVEANNAVDLLSNGFKLRGSSSNTNFGSGTYIFAAFAESPFKTARAR